MTPQEIARQTGKLASVPAVYYQVDRMLDNPGRTSAEIGRVIGQDPALTARLLSVVNTAYYGFPSRIETLPMAITVLGTRALRELLLTVTLTNALRSLHSPLLDMDRYWEHCIYCGVVSKELARREGRIDAEQLFIAGLLHDVGKLAMYQVLPDRMAQIRELHTGKPQPIQQLEQALLGFDHADVGGALLAYWRLPLLYQEAAAYHHRPAEAHDYPDVANLVHVANLISPAAETGNSCRWQTDTDMPPIDPAAEAQVQLTPALIAQLRLEADLQTLEMQETLFEDA